MHVCMCGCVCVCVYVREGGDKGEGAGDSVARGTNTTSM